jgi:hypothetical protein
MADATALPELNEANAPVGTPLRTYSITYSPEVVQNYLDRGGETADLYMVDGVQLVPPGQLMGAYGRLIHDTFHYETGVHVSSEMSLTKTPPVGTTVNVTGEVLNLFERNGDKYVTFSVVLNTEAGEPVASIDHTSIYKLRSRA